MFCCNVVFSAVFISGGRGDREWGPPKNNIHTHRKNFQEASLLLIPSIICFYISL